MVRHSSEAGRGTARYGVVRHCEVRHSSKVRPGHVGCGRAR